MRRILPQQSWGNTFPAAKLREQCEELRERQQTGSMLLESFLVLVFKAGDPRVATFRPRPMLLATLGVCHSFRSISVFALAVFAS